VLPPPVRAILQALKAAHEGPVVEHKQSAS
jgi:hypothetical protein